MIDGKHAGLLLQIAGTAAPFVLVIASIQGINLPESYKSTLALFFVARLLLEALEERRPRRPAWLLEEERRRLERNRQDRVYRRVRFRSTKLAMMQRRAGQRQEEPGGEG